MKRDAAADIDDVAQGMPALLCGDDLDRAGLEDAKVGRLVSLLLQLIHGFLCHGSQRVAFRDLACRLVEAAGRVKAPRPGRSDEVAENVERVQEVRATAVGDRQQARHIRVGEGALLPCKDLEHGHGAVCGRAKGGHVWLPKNFWSFHQFGVLYDFSE
ncbi:hypothetical protein D9M68_630890 [compost metagenome]